MKNEEVRNKIEADKGIEPEDISKDDVRAYKTVTLLGDRKAIVAYIRAMQDGGIKVFEEVER